MNLRRPFLAAVFLAACEKSDVVPPGGAEAPPASLSRSSNRPERVPETRASPRERLDEAIAIADPATRERQLEALAWDSLECDPAIAREALDHLPAGGPAARRLIGHFAMRLADHDPAAAILWAEGFEDSTEQAEAFARIALVLANEDPARAAALVIDRIAPGRERDRAIVRVAQRWTRRDAPAAGRWLSTLPPGPARKAGLRELLGYWIPRSPQQAAAWVAALDSRELRDEAHRAIDTLPAHTRGLLPGKD